MPSRRKFKTSEAKLEKLLEEATVDCYSEEEAFSGVLVTLADNLPVPFTAKLIGEAVEVLGIDERHSSRDRGIAVTVRKDNKEYIVGLIGLELPKSVAQNQWLEMYEYWVGGHG